jgi:hypothetical protein
MLALATPSFVVGASAGKDRFGGIRPNLIFGGAGIRLRRHEVTAVLFLDPGKSRDFETPLLSDLNAGCNSVSDFFAVVRHKSLLE